MSRWISLTEEATSVSSLQSGWKIPMRWKKHAGARPFTMSTTQVWLNWSRGIGDALYSPLLFHVDGKAEGRGGGAAERKRGGTYAQSCNSVSLGEKFTRSVAQVWILNQADVFALISPLPFFFKKKRKTLLWKLSSWRWPSVCPSVKKTTVSAAWVVRMNTVCDTAGLSSIFMGAWLCPRPCQSCLRADVLQHFSDPFLGNSAAENRKSKNHLVIYYKFNLLFFLLLLLFNNVQNKEISLYVTDYSADKQINRLRAHKTPTDSYKAEHW